MVKKKKDWSWQRKGGSKLYWKRSKKGLGGSIFFRKERLASHIREAANLKGAVVTNERGIFWEKDRRVERKE